MTARPATAIKDTHQLIFVILEGSTNHVAPLPVFTPPRCCLAHGIPFWLSPRACLVAHSARPASRGARGGPRRRSALAASLVLSQGVELPGWYCATGRDTGSRRAARAVR